MPIYEYRCTKCNGVTTRKRPVSERKNDCKCQHCATGMAVPIISKSNFQLKGSGWAPTKKNSK